MALQAPIYRLLSIGWALAKPHFLSLSSAFSILKAKSRFRIGFYDTKSTSTRYACMDMVSRIMPVIKMRKVDFVPIFVDQDGPLLELISTKYRK